MHRKTIPGFLLGAAALALAAPASLEAHARILSPKPRFELTAKVGPCGGVPRGETPHVFEAGSEIEVVWDEYIDHPGYYQLSFSLAGDRDFVLLADAIPDVRIPAGQRAAVYSLVVRLPETPCEAGTLQLIQVMTENPSRPELYFSCADIRLVPPGELEVFKRGEVHGDGVISVSDAVRILVHLFAGAEALPCPDAADANDDEALNVADALYLLAWLFNAGPPPPAPGPARCGPDPGADGALDCPEFPPCSPAGGE
jgi:hypothetical protein